jgi:RNA polymerase sigma-70 factor (ECF subfamily)
MVTVIHDPSFRHRPALQPIPGGRVNATAAVALPGEEGARERDASDLASFVTEHYDRLLRLAWLVCRDGADAGDAVQAGLEIAWRRRGTLRDRSSLRSWLDRIVVREAGRIAKRRRGFLGRLFSPRPEVSWIEPMDERIPDRDDRMALRAALARLSPDHRAVVALHLHAGYTVSETAELVGAPIETVRSRLRVAREHLRRELAGAVR